MSKGNSFLSTSGEQLIDAGISGCLVAVRNLLDDGIDMNWKNTLGYTALMWASGKGHVEVVKLFLESGALIDLQNKYGWTALSIASYFGKIDCARLLLERGADISFKSMDGNRTAKDWAVERGHADVAQLLDEVSMLQNQHKYFKYHHMNLI
jgi:ankyrin repeat protein